MIIGKYPFYISNCIGRDASSASAGDGLRLGRKIEEGSKGLARAWEGSKGFGMVREGSGRIGSDGRMIAW